MSARHEEALAGGAAQGSREHAKIFSRYCAAPARQRKDPRAFSAAASYRQPSVCEVWNRTAEKMFVRLRAELGLLGYSLTRTNERDGPVTLEASRWGVTFALKNLFAVVQFVERMGDRDVE